MPFYEYECSHCRFYVEVLQKLSEQPLKKCPSCGKKALKKLVSAPVFRLKGSGWYETDFKSDQEGKRNLAGADKEDSPADTKKEAKPAADGDSKSDAQGDAKSDAKADVKGDAKPDTKADAKADSKRESSASDAKRRGKTGKSEKGAGAKFSGGRSSKPAAKPKKRSAPVRSKASGKRRRGR
jgi:putative FmdB family regulatory protein